MMASVGAAGSRRVLTRLVGSRGFSTENKAAIRRRLLAAKAASGATYDEIAEKTGLTNAYVAQLFHRQAHLKKDTAAVLSEAVPTLSAEDLEAMQAIPDRSFDPNIVQEPTIYRLQEAVLHYGESLKSIINEKCGDGIMSAIDMYCTVDKVKGKLGEDRIVITLNGKFLPHIEQRTENMLATEKPKKKKASKSDS